MKKYELIVIYNATSSEEELDKNIEDVQKTIVSQEGVVDSVDKWGVRDIATEFSKQKSGFYVVFNFSGNNACLDRLNALLRVNERIVRYLVTNKVIIPEKVVQAK